MTIVPFSSSKFLGQDRRKVTPHSAPKNKRTSDIISLLSSLQAALCLFKLLPMASKRCPACGLKDQPERASWSRRPV